MPLATVFNNQLSYLKRLALTGHIEITDEFVHTAADGRELLVKE
jgi:hypothetical protein